MEPKGETERVTLDRREMLKTMGTAAAGMAAGALTSAEAAEVEQAVPGERNAYGAPPGSGISMPPYYLPTPSVKNRNNYFPQSGRSRWRRCAQRRPGCQPASTGPRA